MSHVQTRRGFLKTTAATAGAAIIARPAKAAKLNPPYSLGAGPVTKAEYAALKKIAAATNIFFLIRRLLEKGIVAQAVYFL